ncbi:polysaccharide deacetylase family protein [Nitrogeniibacter aestuarii]|uniref:polysaccharide deacetylase family protein n=1 Tax=Nitrogeniibacter aestuarii TaxID=2815343 RepID=UPI001E472546|nr:polysaccharide deacetylase family protein [Nitrogeniibacter aestuarii]
MMPQANLPRPWRPGSLLWLSLAIHLGALALCVLQPPLWPWAALAVVLNHGVITAVGLWPRSRALGPNWTRLPEAAIQRREIAITIDDGPDPEVTPRVLDLLDAYGAHATFFCIGTTAETHPALVREVVARGHHVENHSHRHRHHFSLLGFSGFVAEIGRAQTSLGQLTGRTPRFFRAPAGLRNPFLEPALARLGLQLAAWTRRGFDTRCGEVDTVFERLSHALAPGDILLLHDGHAARTADGTPVILPVLERLLETCRAQQLVPVTLEAASR